MLQQSLAQTRVIDPILTEIARGYGGNNSPVADALFPPVTVGQRAGRIISFGTEDFRIVNTARAPGANTKRVQFGYTSGNFSLVDYSLEGSVPIEHMQEANAVPGIDLGRVAVMKVRNMQSLEKEKQCADLARNAALYPAANKVAVSAGDKWGAATTIFDQVEAGKEAIRAAIGRRPNVMVLPPKVLSALRRNANVLNRLSTASDRAPATVAQLQQLFEVDRIVEAGAIMHDGTNFSDVWGTDVVMAYATPASLADMGSPSYGYTYQLEGYPVVEEPYFDRNPKTWFYPVTDSRAPYLVGPSAGFLFQAAV